MVLGKSCLSKSKYFLGGSESRFYNVPVQCQSIAYIHIGDFWLGLCRVVNVSVVFLV